MVDALLSLAVILAATALLVHKRGRSDRWPRRDLRTYSEILSDFLGPASRILAKLNERAAELYAEEASHIVIINADTHTRVTAPPPAPDTPESGHDGPEERPPVNTRPVSHRRPRARSPHPRTSP